jgi:hypothetical protein
MGVWAVLLQIMVPLGQAVPAPPGVAGPPRTLVVCSALQRRVIPGPGSLPDASAGGQRQAGSVCPVCAAYAAAASMLPPTVMAAPRPAVDEQTPAAGPRRSLVTGIRLGLPQPRGPPAIA